ncbi:hypothetical protein PICSAR118_01116 [Mycobacterium avium subsp. paratuberculosis]|nr:hypothetical protein PICSAR118_01116 [Mycobacterium avium subsp. paratuberculosis]
METRGILDEHVALAHVFQIPDGGTVTQRGDRQPEKLPQFHDFGDGAFGQPGMDQFADQVAVLPPADLEPQLFDLLQLRAFDHRGEVEPLLTGDHGDPDVAVLGGFDRRDFGGATDRRDTQQLRMQPFAALHRGQRLQHGQVEVFAGTAALDAAAQRQHAERGEHTAHVLAQIAPDGDRRPGRVAAEPRRARPRLQRELGGGPLREGARPAEVGDGDDDGARRLPQQSGRVDAQRRGPRRAGGDDDDVGAGQFGAKARSVVVAAGAERHAAFARVEVAEKRRVGAGGDGRTARRIPAQPIPLRRFDFAHLRAGVEQQLAAVAAGYPVADLDDTQIP